MDDLIIAIEKAMKVLGPLEAPKKMGSVVEINGLICGFKLIVSNEILKTILHRIPTFEDMDRLTYYKYRGPVTLFYSDIYFDKIHVGYIELKESERNELTLTFTPNLCHISKEDAENMDITPITFSLTD